MPDGSEEEGADATADSAPVPASDTGPAPVCNHTVSIGDEDSYWTVIAPGTERSMRSKGFRASFHPHFKKLSAFNASVPFFMPKRIPFGHRLLVTDQQLTSKKTKFKKYGANEQPGSGAGGGGGKGRKKHGGTGGSGKGKKASNAGTSANQNKKRLSRACPAFVLVTLLALLLLL